MTEQELQQYADNYLANYKKQIYPKGDLVPDLKEFLDRVYYDVYERGVGCEDVVRRRIAAETVCALEEAYKEAYK
jgi:hypothetical protein